MSETYLETVRFDLKNPTSITDTKNALDQVFKTTCPTKKDYCRKKAQTATRSLTKIVQDASLCDYSKIPDEFYDLIQVLYRGMRNYIVHNLFSQDLFIESDPNFLTNTANILSGCVQRKDKCVLYITQFLCNLMVKNEKNAQLIWKNVSETLLSNFKLHDELIAAVLYNIFLLHPEYIRDCHPIYSKILNIFAENSEYDDQPFYLYELLRLFVHDKEFMCRYTSFSLKERITVLIVISNNLDSSKNDGFNLENIKIQEIIEHFLLMQENLHELNEKNKIFEILELQLMLQIIASYAAIDNFKLYSKDCLTNKCVRFLIQTHKLGKTENDVFTPINKVVSIEEEKRIQEEPFYNLKAQLVRAIGNLCHKDKHNQDKIREMECIPVILECCNIDAKNPFIQQWAIAAVRYLCEDNLKNQEVVGCMKQLEKVNQT